MKTSFAILFLSGFMLCAIGCNEDNAETEPVLIETAEEHLARLLSDYTNSMECVTPIFLNSNYQCMLHASGPRMSQSFSPSDHAQKIFHLYTNAPDEYKSAVEDKAQAPVGLVLVKENHEIQDVPVGSVVTDEVAPNALFPAKVRHKNHLEQTTRIPGKISDLFFMAKIGQDSIFQTDKGWVYGGMDLNGKIISISSIGNCHDCHKFAPNDRLFGLPRAETIYMGEKTPQSP